MAASPFDRLVQDVPEAVSQVQLDHRQILDATEAVFREKGYDGLTIRALSRELGCAVGSIYRYFPNKRDLLEAMCTRLLEPVAIHAELGRDPARGAADYARAAHGQPDTYRLLFWLTSVRQPRDAQSLPEVIGRILASWSDALGGYLEAHHFWCQLHGALMAGLTPETTLGSMGLLEAQPEAAPQEVVSSKR